jgi:predicted amino acid-binding ACT domain protein
MLDPELVEIGKTALRSFFSLMAQTGLTQEEMKTLSDEVLEEFKENSAEDLPDA